MKKLNKSGFTLIELLAVIVILGVIMLIAIPSVSSIIANSKKNTYVSSAQTLITGARNLVLSTSTGLPDNSWKALSTTEFNSLSGINNEISTTTYSKAYAIQVKNIAVERGSNTKSAYGLVLDTNLSYVVALVRKDNSSKVDYYIQMRDSGGNAIKLTSEQSLEEGNSKVTTGMTNNNGLVSLTF